MTTTGHWFVQQYDAATPWSTHPNEAAAVREAKRHKQAVAWFCSSVEIDESQESVA